METVVFTDNSVAVLDALRAKALAALGICGGTAAAYARALCPVDTGRLRDSIESLVDSAEQAVYVGTDVPYGVFVELGTGIYADGGRDTPWVYRGADGRFHMTRGTRAKAFVAPAVAGHSKEYGKIIESVMKDGM